MWCFVGLLVLVCVWWVMFLVGLWVWCGWVLNFGVLVLYWMVCRLVVFNLVSCFCWCLFILRLFCCCDWFGMWVWWCFCCWLSGWFCVWVVLFRVVMMLMIWLVVFLSFWCLSLMWVCCVLGFIIFSCIRVRFCLMIGWLSVSMSLVSWIWSCCFFCCWWLMLKWLLS